MHPEELCHEKDHARIPRDSEGHKKSLEENRGDDEYSQLRITLGSVTTLVPCGSQSMSTLLHR